MSTLSVLISNKAREKECNLTVPKSLKEKMESRRVNRRNRRNRKWYRPKRFKNRASSKRSGRLPPSIKTNVEEVIRVIKRLPLPISSIVIEDVQVDIARLNNPILKGSQYQDPTRLDENLRYDLPRKGQGRVRYQVNEELAGFRKGDIVRVKGKYVKQISSIYSDGRLAFKRVKDEPSVARPKDCQRLSRGQTIIWEKVA